MPNLLPHQVRVIDERVELASRIERLDVFLQSSASSRADDRDLLQCQLYAMRSYHCILSERINRWQQES